MGDSKQYPRILPNEYTFDIKIHFLSFFVKKQIIWCLNASLKLLFPYQDWDLEAGNFRSFLLRSWLVWAVGPLPAQPVSGFPTDFLLRWLVLGSWQPWLWSWQTVRGLQWVRHSWVSEGAPGFPSWIIQSLCWQCRALISVLCCFTEKMSFDINFYKPLQFNINFTLIFL